MSIYPSPKRERGIGEKKVNIYPAQRRELGYRREKSEYIPQCKGGAGLYREKCNSALNKAHGIGEKGAWVCYATSLETVHNLVAGEYEKVSVQSQPLGVVYPPNKNG